MEINKENIYINLQGKSSKEKRIIYNLLNEYTKDNKDDLCHFLSCRYLQFKQKKWFAFNTWRNAQNKQEVTIQQLKEILQPMEKFTPIAMKCNQEQFEAIKPKLKEIGKIWQLLGAFTKYEYLTNNYDNKLTFDFIPKTNEWFEEHKCNIHEEWNEEVFLKACGIEVETLEQQLEKAKAEVKRIEKEIEDSKIKIGDWVRHNNGQVFKVKENVYNLDVINESAEFEKITDQELINKLNNLIK